ncbi:unnamed protein product [Sphagnum balticum]
MLWKQVTGIDFHPFCKMAVARNVTTCPDIPTFDILDADAFTGTWYEVGSTAQFKLSAEAGMSCPQVTYSLATTPHTGFNQGVVFNVLNSGVQVISPLAALEVHNINQGTKDICWNARDVCSMLASGSLQQSLAELAQVSSRVEEGSPDEASTLRAVQSKISTATENITLQLDGLAYHMIDIQTHNGYLSQANGTDKSSVDEIKHAILQARQNKAAIMELVSQIANAREELIKVAFNLFLAGYVIQSVDITQASLLIAAIEVGIVSKTTNIGLSFTSIGSAAGLTLNNKPHIKKPLSFPSTAFQNATSGGKLQLMIRGLPAPYWIIALEGFPSDSYEAALIYSCTQNLLASSTTQQSIIVISRTPQINPATLGRFMAVSGSLGIGFDCEDPFLFSSSRC